MPPLICEVHLCQPENKEEEEGRGSATDHKPREPGRRARPEAQEALLGEDPVRAVERAAVRLARLQALHPRLDHAAQFPSAPSMREFKKNMGEGTHSRGMVV